MSAAEQDPATNGFEQRADEFMRALAFADLTGDEMPEKLSDLLEPGESVEIEVGGIALAASRVKVNELDDQMPLFRDARGAQAIPEISFRDFRGRSVTTIHSDLHGGYEIVYDDESGRRIRPREIIPDEHASQVEKRRVFMKLLSGRRK